jgi:hypothetical protein
LSHVQVEICLTKIKKKIPKNSTKEKKTMRQDKSTLLNNLSVLVSNKEENKSQKDQKNNKTIQSKSKEQIQQFLNNQTKAKKTIRMFRCTEGTKIRSNKGIESLVKERSSRSVDRYKLRISGCEFKILNKNKECIEEEKKALM